jgi:hypothetical protein
VLERQLDLFAAIAPVPDRSWTPGADGRTAPEALDDAALLAAIPSARLGECSALAAEAARRRLGAAVLPLKALCERFCGFGADRLVPEQAAALEALAAIGGRDSARAVAALIRRGAVQGPALAVALDAAARLRAALSAETLGPLLRHGHPGTRANACRCAGRAPALVPVLVELLDDPEPRVARAAACALGQMGRVEARPPLIAALRQAPDEDVIAAASALADEECMVLLGRVARSSSRLAEAALSALDEMDHPRAAAIAAGIRLRA